MDKVVNGNGMRMKQIIVDRDARFAKSMSRANLIMAWAVVAYFACHLMGCAVYAGSAGATSKLMDGLNGMIAEGKAPPSKNPYMKLRAFEARQETKRAFAPSFLDLFRQSSATVVNEQGGQDGNS